MQFIPPKKESPLFIDGPAGKIEVMLGGAKGREEESVNIHAIGIMSHPHPLQGGTMNNKVVTTIVRSWLEQGLMTLRFNFRGVGSSEGTYDNGEGEAKDLQAVIEYCKKHYPGYPIWLAGFSFGAFISLKVASKYPLAGLISLGLPLSHFEMHNLSLPDCPWLIIHGTEDELTPMIAINEWYQNNVLTHSLTSKVKLVLIAGASHFFHGNLNRLKEEVKSFMEAYLS